MTEATSGASRFEIPTWECWSLVAAERIGRVCVVDHGYPVALPVSFVVTDPAVAQRIVLRAARDTLIGRADGGLVSVEVDHIDLEHGPAWSVIVRGRLRSVHGDHQLPDPHPLVREGRHQWMAIEPSSISGRRFVVQVAQDGFSVDWEMAGSNGS